MGIVVQTIDRLNRLDIIGPHKGYRAKDTFRMLEFGCQNIYTPHDYYPGMKYGMIAKSYFENVGMRHISVDYTGEQGSLKKDLREPLNLGLFDVVTDFGTIEHVEGSLYMPMKNMHDACIVDGLIMHEVPKTGHWPGHGYHYFTKEIFQELAVLCEYNIVEIGEFPAMGNEKDGWNVFVVYRKTKDNKFVSKTKFDRIEFPIK